jgi:hypothetical protein
LGTELTNKTVFVTRAVVDLHEVSSLGAYSWLELNEVSSQEGTFVKLAVVAETLAA